MTDSVCIPSGWSPITSATAESTLSGILAGFVFLGMVAIWTVELPHAKQNAEWKRRRAYVLQLFAVAFITFALDSYLMAITSGESDCNRAIVESAFSGGALGVGAAVTLVGLAWLLVALSEQISELQYILRYMLGGAGFLIIFMLAQSAVGIGGQLEGERSHLLVNTLSWCLGAVLLIAVIVAVRRALRSDSACVDKAVKNAALTALATGIISTLLCGIGSSTTISFWSRAPDSFIDAITVLIVVMPGIALTMGASAVVAALTATFDTEEADGAASLSEPSSAVDDQAAMSAIVPPTRPSSRRLRLPSEPLTADLIRKRSLDAFSGGYLTFIAIIQGVAFAVLADHALALIDEHRRNGWWVLSATGQSAATLTAILVVTSEYLWFTSVMGWPLTFLDTLTPYALGAGEISAARFIGHKTAWWFGFAALAAGGIFAYTRTYMKSRMISVDPQRLETMKMKSLIRRLSKKSIVLSTPMFILAAVAGVCSRSDHPLITKVIAAATWVPVVGALALVKSSGTALDEIYEAFELDRRGASQDRGDPSSSNALQTGQPGENPK